MKQKPGSVVITLMAKLHFFLELFISFNVVFVQMNLIRKHKTYFYCFKLKQRFLLCFNRIKKI